MWRITDQWLRSKGLDYRKRPLEIACFAHAINGGLRIDQKAETTIKGLYAAGETAGGPHGADRLGGNMLVTCMVFGEIAGFNAEQNAKDAPVRSPSTSILSDAERYLHNHYKQNGFHNITSLKSQLQDCMWRNALVVRSEKRLLDCMESIFSIRDKAEKCNVEKQDAFSPFELENMLVVSEIMTRAALERKESRGSHYREDFPEQGGQEWKRPISFHTIDES
jgi:succinate dehydrogenase/fumarate reductase flavoprotein subunit